MMKNKFFAVALMAVLVMFGFNAQAIEGVDDNSTEMTTPELLTQELDNDVVYGNKDAAITIVEYASLSCSHCANFYETTFKQIKKDYIDTGKVKLVYRHFPLNLPALQGGLVVNCFKDEDARKKLIGTLFESQGNWAYTNDFSLKLKNIARIAGMSNEDFDNCISDTEGEEKLLDGQLKAQQGLLVKSTPTIFVNGQPYIGARTYEGFSKYLDNLM